ncbi:hypothetical protein ACNOYE_20795 [Nannocystaceae bacterium ST9]
MMTCAHVLLNSGFPTFQDALNSLLSSGGLAVRYNAGYNDGAVYPMVPACSIAYPVAYAQLWHQINRDKHDYAFCFLSGNPQPFDFWFGVTPGLIYQPQPPSQSPWLSIYNNTSDFFIHQIGFPACGGETGCTLPIDSCANGISNGMYQSVPGCGSYLHFPSGYDQDPNLQPRKFQTNCACGPGASGSPGFVVLNDQAWVIGIVEGSSGTKASHVLITDSIVDQFVLAKAMFESASCDPLGLGSASLP